MRRWLLGTALVLAIGAAAVLAWGWYVLVEGLPQIEGEVRVRGAEGPVDIVRDVWGVPHIFATSESDAYFGLGFAVAQDRLFQLALFRQLAQGRMAEVVGAWAPVVKLDTTFRTLDLHGMGQAMFRRAAPDVQAAFRAYYGGVNAYLEHRDGRLPLDVRLLAWAGLERPFAPDDLVGMVGVMGLRLHPSWRNDLLFEQLVTRLGRNRAEQLFPLSLGGKPAVVPEAEPAPVGILAAQPPAAGPAWLAPVEAPPAEPPWWMPWSEMGASNNWAVAPRRSATGKAMLASDPHLGLSLPGTWYLAHLKAGDLEVAGATFPGLPFVVFGHNTHIAWGLTNVTADSGDFFLEQLDGGQPGQVRIAGVWQPLTERQETIAGWWGTQEVTIRETPHGPLVTDLVPEEVRAGLPPGSGLAYRWAYRVDSAGNDLEAFYRLNRARDWNAFRQALRPFSALVQNWAYADREGNIGVQVAGAMPQLPGDGKGFRRGWDGSQEWEGLVPYERLPSVYNPRRGWVGSANNSTFEPPTPFYVSAYFEPGVRMARIGQLLSARERLTVADMRAMQLDTTLAFGPSLAAQVVAAHRGHIPARPLARQALGLLARWPGDFGAESRGATVFAHVYARLHEEVFGDELGEHLTPAYRGYAAQAALLDVLAGRLTRWVDDIRTEETEDLPQLLRRAFAAAVGRLELEVGADPTAWAWGDVHRLQLEHPLGRIPGLGGLFNIDNIPANGHNLTLNRMGFRPGSTKIRHGTSARVIVDFADVDNMLAVLPDGQSGVPLSPFYSNLNAVFRRGGYITLRLRRDQIAREGSHALTLRPR